MTTDFFNKIFPIVEKWYLSDEDTAEDSMNEIKLIIEEEFEDEGLDKWEIQKGIKARSVGK